MRGSFLKLFFILFTFVCFTGKVCDASNSSASGNCLDGAACDHCPRESVEWYVSGQSRCCPGCRGLPITGSSDATCICLQDPKEEHWPTSRIIYHGSPKEIPSRQESLDKLSFEAPLLHSQQDSTESLKRAINQMADAIEKIDERLRFVEERIQRMNHLKNEPNPVFDSYLTNKKQKSSRCKDNFIQVEENCIFASVYTNQRANWKDAKIACEKMGTNLAEVPDHKHFVAVTSFLTSASITAGHSYWMGGVYPGAMWIWLTSGAKVTMNPSYWTSLRHGLKEGSSSGVAGDIRHGRCLGLHYIFGSRGYGLGGDQCTYKNYYLCQKKIE